MGIYWTTLKLALNVSVLQIRRAFPTKFEKYCW